MNIQKIQTNAGTSNVMTQISITSTSPPASSPFSVLGNTFLIPFSKLEISFPIRHTGWYNHLGSPNIKSKINPAAKAIVWYVYINSVTLPSAVVFHAFFKKSLCNFWISIIIKMWKSSQHSFCAMNTLPVSHTFRFCCMKCFPQFSESK